MTDPTLLRIEHDLRERTAFRAPCDPPDVETARWFAERLRAVRDELPRADVLRLETVAEHLTGVRAPRQPEA